MSVSRFVLPVLVVAALWGGYFLRTAFTQPTAAASFEPGGGEQLTCVVEGLKCKGTANFFMGLYQGKPGISSIETFASEHRAVFTYDPSIISPDAIRAIMEAPIPLRDGRRIRAFRCLEMK